MKNLLPWLFCCLIALPVVGTAQQVRYLVECDRGASFVANATHRTDGTILVVGDLGRVGTYKREQGRITWECLPSQAFLYDVWSRNDTTIVVGESGDVWFIVEGARWKSSPLPMPDTCRSIAVHNGVVYVGTQEGRIWQRAALDAGAWTLSYQASAAVIEMCSHNQRLIAVGRKGGLYERDIDWIDRSMKYSTLEFAAIAVVGNVYVIGADSGKVFRYNAAAESWTSTQLMTPFTNAFITDFRGREDKTLCITHGPNGSLIATGNYYVSPQRWQTGVYESVDSGVSWTHHRLFDENNLADLVFPIFCPTVGYENNRVSVLLGTAGQPICVFESDSAMEEWKFALRSEDIFRPLDTIIDGIRGRCTTIVRSAVVVEPHKSYLVLREDVATTFAFSSFVQKVSYVAAVRLIGDTTTLDTLATLPGRFLSMRKIDNEIFAGGDSGRIAVSGDTGKTWTFEWITASDSYKYVVASIFRLNGILYAHTFSNADTNTPLRLYGLFENRRNGLGWQRVSISLPENTTARISKVVTDYEERCLLLSEIRSENGDLHYAVIEYDTTSGLFSLIDSLPYASTTIPAIFYHGNDIGALIPIETPGDITGVRMKCHYVDSDWICDTARVKHSGDYKAYKDPSTLSVVDTGDKLVGYSLFYSFGSLISLDHGLHWNHLPTATTLFSGKLIFAVADQSRLVVGGLNDYLAVISFDSTSTSVPPDVVHKVNDKCDLKDFYDGVQLVHCEVFDARGRLLSMIDSRSLEVTLEQASMEPSRVYVLRFITDTRDCSLLLMR